MNASFPASKICTRCDVEKPLDGFYRNRSGRYGRLSHCKECHKTLTNTPEAKARNAVHCKTWWRKNPEKLSARHRRNTYGLSQEQFDALSKEQNGTCAICKKEIVGRICVDHDHQTGAVRGLLCNSCNSGIGNLQDSIEVLAAAIDYLRRSKLNQS